MKKNIPRLSVVMSTYNGERFLAKSIDSILAQTFTEYELIIINDGATDNSPAIIKGYNDSRIRYIEQSNKGLTASLNIGIDAAKGAYIARMDHDDIALPERFERQIKYLDQHAGCSVVATCVDLIDEEGLPLPPWNEDRDAISPEQIYHYLAFSNCIAHPSIMARTDVITKFRYREVAGGEDYDLWMRLAASGHQLAKLPESLLLYRIHSTSITQTINQRSIKKKLLRIQIGFLLFQLRQGRLGHFELLVVFKIARFFLGKGLWLLKKLLSWPLALCERWVVPIPAKQPSKPALLFISPWVTMGGADKVFLDLCRHLSGYSLHLLTTEHSENVWTDRFLAAGVEVHHIPRLMRFRQNYVYFIDHYIAKNGIKRVIISNSAIGYQATKRIKRRSPNVKIIDLLHGQGGKIDNGSAPKFSYPYRTYLDKRITVSNYLIDYMEDTYNLPRSNFTCIPNGVDFAELRPSSHNSYRHKLAIPAECHIVSWVGRLSDEKKPLLALHVAKRVIAHDAKAVFVFAGDGPQRNDVEAFIAAHNLGKNIKLLGTIDDTPTLLAESDILLMTSEMEGYSLVLVEAQAMAIPVVATNVGGNGEIVRHNKTGLLVEYNATTEKALTTALNKLLDDPHFRKSLADEAKQTAQRFSLDKMVRSYEDIIG